MTDQSRWKDVERLYHATLARKEPDRQKFLRDSCGGDEALQREVESLIAYAAKAHAFMMTPALDVIAAAAESDGADESGSDHGQTGAKPESNRGQTPSTTRPLIGHRLGPYEIVSLLGAGGMGEVYRAQDLKLGRDVAVKILPDAFVADADRRARFEREARLLASLNHPHIGAIYGFEDRGGIHALILELVEGRTLAELATNGPIPLGQALAIARQIVDALEAAHDRGIVHRDLKPANVILQDPRPPISSHHSAPRSSEAASSPKRSDSFGVSKRSSAIRGDAGQARVDPALLLHDEVRVKVVDFGLAKIGESSHDPAQSPTMTVGMTHDGLILGTASYMSPEQARGRVVDKRTDIWAFGCVLYEMLTGRQAFPGETVSDTIAAILERGPDWSALPDSTPATIRRLLQRSLERDPRRRLHDIADARLEIDDACREPAASPADRASTERQLTPATARTMWGFVAVGVVLVTIGVVAGAMWRRSIPPQRSASLARLTIALAAGQAIEKGRFPPVALSPDGKLLVYTATVDGGRTNLYVRPIDDLIARPIPETDGATTPFFSPDGRWLAFYSDGLLKKVSITGGGVPLTICEAPPLWSATWGENDTILFAPTLAASGIWLVTANGGEPAQITTLKPDDVQHAYPQILPGGTQAIFSVRRRNAWHLALLSLKSGGWQVLGSGRAIGEGARYLTTGHLVYAQSGGLVVLPFDPASGALDRAAVPLLERPETSHFGGAYFAVASDAGTLAYVPAATTVDERTLLRVDRDGRSTPLVDARAAYESPALSPDGRRVAVMMASDSGSDIWIIDLERSTRTRFTTGGSSAFPVWASGGARLAFQSVAPGPWNLFWKPLDGSTDAQPILRPTDSSARSWPNTGENLLPGTLPTLSGAGPQFPTSWAPDGSTLAFYERKPNGERDIWVVSPGSDPTPFVLTPFDERSARFAPNGKWLAYVSDESGRNEIYVQPFPGPGAKWLVSTDGGIDPVWSRDGRELFYRKNDELVAVAVTTAPEFSAARPHRLFEMRFDSGDDGPGYDVSPDGRWFVMLKRERGHAPAALHLVLDWFAEVTSRTRTTTGRVGDASPAFAARWRALP